MGGRRLQEVNVFAQQTRDGNKKTLEYGLIVRVREKDKREVGREDLRERWLLTTRPHNRPTGEEEKKRGSRRRRRRKRKRGAAEEKERRMGRGTQFDSGVISFQTGPNLGSICLIWHVTGKEGGKACMMPRVCYRTL